jgi:hypothetical protein
MSAPLFCAVRTDGLRGLPTINFMKAKQEASKLGLQWSVRLVPVVISGSDHESYRHDMETMPLEQLTEQEVDDLANRFTS